MYAPDISFPMFMIHAPGANLEIFQPHIKAINGETCVCLFKTEASSRAYMTENDMGLAVRKIENAQQLTEIMHSIHSAKKFSKYSVAIELTASPFEFFVMKQEV